MDLVYWLLIATEILIGILVVYEINSPNSTYRRRRDK